MLKMGVEAGGSRKHAKVGATSPRASADVGHPPSAVQVDTLCPCFSAGFARGPCGLGLVTAVASLIGGHQSSRSPKGEKHYGESTARGQGSLMHVCGVRGLQAAVGLEPCPFKGPFCQRCNWMWPPQTSINRVDRK